MYQDVCAVQNPCFTEHLVIICWVLLILFLFIIGGSGTVVEFNPFVMLIQVCVTVVQ